MCLGFCATSHLDAVLSKLETVTKTDISQKKSGMFSFMKVCLLLGLIVLKVKLSIPLYGE